MYLPNTRDIATMKTEGAMIRGKAPWAGGNLFRSMLRRSSATTTPSSISRFDTSLHRARCESYHLCLLSSSCPATPSGFSRMWDNGIAEGAAIFQERLHFFG
jgi:hypothetical protein